MLLSGLTAINAESIDSENVVITEEAGVDKESVKGTVIGYVGDNDGNDTVNIKDATNIQKHLADIVTMNENSVLLSDVDDNGAVNIKDSTTIQKFIAGIPVDAIVNHLMYVPEGSTSNEHTHNYSAVTVAPTCTEKGYTEYTCACGDSYKDNFADPAGHKYVDGICSVCGAKEPHVHSYATVIVAPTCTEKGYTEYTCSCGDSYKDNFADPAGHKYVDGICSVCGAKEPHVHSYSAVTVASTCMEKGYTKYTCSCGDSYKDNWIATYGYHNFENYECTACGISPFDYYVEWIKENGTVYGDHYEYAYPTITDIAGFENTYIEALYYPTRGDTEDYIALACYDMDSDIDTWVTLDDSIYAYCICGNETWFDLSTYIDITTFTSNTPIDPVKYTEGSFSYLFALEQARSEIVLTILLHDRCMEDAGVGLSVVDLGFYSIYSDNSTITPPIEDNVVTPPSNDYVELDPILICNDFPLHLYSNDGKVYLGKLTTNKYDSDSIWNTYGTYGSKYSSKSIWNEYGTYGSKYNSESAFNPYTSTPPIIVTNSGKEIGYLTANEYKVNGYTITELERILKSIGQ